MVKKIVNILICLFGIIPQTEVLGVNMKNLIRNKEMAIGLAEFYIAKIYGEDVAKRQQPYDLKDNDKEWIISGKPPEALGGSFRIVIEKKDGRVIEIMHSR